MGHDPLVASEEHCRGATELSTAPKMGHLSPSSGLCWLNVTLWALDSFFLAGFSRVDCQPQEGSPRAGGH